MTKCELIRQLESIDGDPEVIVLGHGWHFPIDKSGVIVSTFEEETSCFSDTKDTIFIKVDYV